MKKEAIKTIIILLLVFACALEFYVIKNGPIHYIQDDVSEIRTYQGEIISYEEGGSRDRFVFYIKQNNGVCVRLTVSETTQVYIPQNEYDFRSHNYYDVVEVMSECKSTDAWSYLNYPATIVSSLDED